ncbi:serine/threonine protein kinase [Roseateles sp.]|uniref:serine/threonine protein kinase n=1 Tax=Roseateles sp. TaxID=1971397 RepID=UPI003D0F0874
MSDVPFDRTGLRAQGAPVEDVNALPPGTRFGSLEILRTLGVGGFGIVYLARDHALERELAIKEYMPGQLAQRGEGSAVSVRSASLSETFEIGRRSFVNEARLLARFDHRSLLKVFQFWEAHGTAYMAMPYLQGQTLRQRRDDISAGRAPALDEAALRRLLLPLLEALSLLHGAAVFHRDIAPDNILLPDDGGDPILLDFGAARRAIGDRTQTFTAILKPSYAPIEQYAESTALRQGPWTDVYALGAVLHFLLTGQPPPPATARAVFDDYEPLAGRALAGCSRAFLAAIDWSLAVRPLERPQSMEAFRDALTGVIEPPGLQEADLPLPLSAPEPRPRRAAAPAGRSTPRPAAAAAAVPAARTGLPGAWRWAAWVIVPVLLALGAWLLQRPAAPVVPAASPGLALADPASGPASAAVPALAWNPEQAPAQAPPASSPAVLASATTPALQKAAVPAARASAPPGKSEARRPPRDGGPAQAQAATKLPAMPQQDASLTAAAPSTQVQLVQPPAAAASEGAPTAPLDPRQACAKENILLRVWCVDRRCEKPAFAGHAECVRLREIREQRRER